MITSLSGILVEKTQDYAVVSVGGIGFRVTIPLTTFRELPRVDDPITLHTYLYLREDEIRLYGFYSEEEREMFELLMTVSGVGAKMAVDVVSYLPVSQFVRAVQHAESALLCQAPGIGKKRAERLIFDLKNSKHPLFLRVALSGDGRERPAVLHQGRVMESVEALMTLGLKPMEAQRAIAEAVKTLGENAEVKDLVREGLKHR